MVTEPPKGAGAVSSAQTQADTQIWDESAGINVVFSPSVKHSLERINGAGIEVIQMEPSKIP